MRLHLRPGVYVPRWTTEVVAAAALSRLPPAGVALDVCCGSGAVAAVLRDARPGARILATELDPVAAACATSNGVDCRVGDLFDPLPADLRGGVDVIASVPPFVPAGEIAHLPRDVRDNETELALDGGVDGLRVAARVVEEAPAWLTASGSLVVQVGAEQVPALTELCRAAGLPVVEVLVDGDGDACGVAARRA